MSKMTCHKCGNEQHFFAKVRGPHFGLYCADCTSWIKWIAPNTLREAVGEDDLQKVLAMKFFTIVKH